MGDIDLIIHVNVFFTDDDEEEHLEWLQKVVEKITEASLKLNQKKLSTWTVPHGLSGLPGINRSGTLGQLSEEVGTSRSTNIGDQRMLGLFN